MTGPSFPFSILRGTLRYWIALNLSITLIVLGVHYYGLNVDQSNSLALSNLILDLKRLCDPEGVDRHLAMEARLDPTSRSALYNLLSRNAPPASLFALRVWVEEEALLPAVHTTLRTVNDRLVQSLPPPLVQTQRQYARQVLLHRLVRLDQPPADLWLTESPVTPTPVPESVGDVPEANYSAETNLVIAPPRVPLNAFDSLAQARHLLVRRASYQQLGLPTLQHAFTPDPKAELQMMSVSLIRLPPALHASYMDWLAAADGHDSRKAVSATLRVAEDEVDTGARVREKTHCERFDSHQFYCVLPPRTSTDTTRATVADKLAVQMALTSVLAEDMQIASFRDPNAMHLFFLLREQAGCMHTYRSVVALQQSMRDHPDMKVPHSVHPILKELKHVVQQKQFVLAARAADALQFHPLLTPQLYIPFDHNLVSHVLILLPVLSLTLLCVRFLRDMFLVDRQARRSAQSGASTSPTSTVTTGEDKATGTTAASR